MSEEPRPRDGGLPWPTEVRLRKGRRTVLLALDDGSRHEVGAELIRVMTPSAERKGHSPAEEKVIGGKRDVTIRGIEPVGNYALRFVFDDGHQTGLYTIPYLVDLAVHRDRHFAAYEAQLAVAGLSRDAPGEATAARAR
jgi:DUF971 family protein